MHKVAFGLAMVSFLGITLPAAAQYGPVATACAADIQKYCGREGSWKSADALMS